MALIWCRLEVSQFLHPVTLQVTSPSQRHGYSHPQDVAGEEVEERNMCAYSPLALMTLEEGGQNALLHRGVDLTVNFLCSNSGSSV